MMNHGWCRLTNTILVCLLMLSSIPALHQGATAQDKKEKAPAIPGPMLDQGILNLETPEFNLDLVRSSQTVAALRPKVAAGFDFTPGDLLVERSKDGFYHLGDLELRVRMGEAARLRLLHGFTEAHVTHVLRASYQAMLGYAARL